MTNFCTECGTPRDDGGKFCMNCGTAFTTSESQLEPVPPPPPTADGANSTRFAGIERVRLTGPIIAAISAFMPWLGAGGTSFNGFDLPALVILDYEAPDEGIRLGWLVIVLAGVALAGYFVRSTMIARMVRVAGIAEIAIGLLFLNQTNQAASATSRSLIDLIGLAPIVTIVGGAMIVFANGRSRSALRESTG